MRTELIPTENRDRAIALADWANFYARTPHGYMAFEFRGDYLVWRERKRAKPTGPNPNWSKQYLRLANKSERNT